MLNFSNKFSSSRFINFHKITYSDKHTVGHKETNYKCPILHENTNKMSYRVQLDDNKELIILY